MTATFTEKVHKTMDDLDSMYDAIQTDAGPGPKQCYQVGDSAAHPSMPIPGEALAEAAVCLLLRYLRQDPYSNGLKDTPKRVLKALREMTIGYFHDPREILSRTFDQTYDEVIVLKGIPFTSLCEHHLLAFEGTVDVGYIPAEQSGKVVGLSKLARLVDCFAKRLQIQERMTQEIANALVTHLNPKGVAVVVRAEHSCMSCRGVKKSGSVMITSAMLGAFRDNPTARSEFLNL